MSLVEPYIDNLERIKSKLGDVAREALIENLDLILFLIKEKQLGVGEDSDGNVVGTYNQSYAGEDKEASGGRYPRESKDKGDPYNFDWFGSFKDGIYVKVNNDDGFDILSRDGKVAILEHKYGKNAKLLKLTEEHNNQINYEVVMPALGKYISKNMFIL